MNGRRIRHGWTGAMLSETEMFNEIICLVNRWPNRRQFFVCCGESGTGKTEAFFSLRQQLNSNDLTRVNEKMCALQFSAPMIVSDYEVSVKQVMNLLWSDALGYPLHFLGRRTVDEISCILSIELCRRSIRLFLVDDAQLLSPSFMRALLSVRIFQLGTRPLSFVFIGTNELYDKILGYPDIIKQVTEWYSFEK